MREKKIRPIINYRLTSIEVLECKLESPQTPEMPASKFHFKINITHRTNKEKKSLFVVIEILISTTENSKILGSIKVAIIFELENFELYIDKKIGEVKVPKGFDIELNSISISTVRGIMFSSFKGTYLHKAILPLINPSLLMLSEVKEESKTGVL